MADAQAPDIDPTETPVVTETPEIEFEPDFQRALDAFNAAKQEAAAEKPAPEVEKPTEVPSAAPVVQAEPEKPKIDTDPKLDEKFTAVTNRLSKSEAERQSLEQRVKAAEEKAAKAEKLEQLFTGAMDGKVADLFQELGMPPEAVQAYAEGKPFKPNREVAKVTTLVEQQAKELQELKQKLQQTEAQQVVSTFKQQISSDLKPLAEKYPYLFQAYESDLSQMTDAVFGTMHAVYQQEGKELSVEELAHTANQHWEKIAKRFGPRSESPTAISPAVTQASKQQPATKKPDVSNPATIEDADEPQLSDDEKRMNAALATFKAAKREIKSA